jgi:hypothetical protein
MKIRILAVAALFVAPIAAAQQPPDTSPGAAAIRIYDWCLELETGTVSECACVAGFYAGATEPDEFSLLSSTVPYFDINGDVEDVDAMRADLLNMKAALSMTEERYNEILAGFAAFGELGPRADAVCIPVESEAVAAE